MLELQSENITDIAKAIIEIQPMLSNVVRDKAGYGYVYADLPQVLQAIREPLEKTSLAITQQTTYEDGQALLVTTLLHKTGQWIRGFYPLNPAGIKKANDAQQFGAALSYARRYCLLSLLNITQADDDAQCLGSESRKINKVISMEQAKQITDAIKSKGYDIKYIDLQQTMGVYRLGEIQQDNFQAVINGIKQWNQVKVDAS